MTAIRPDDYDLFFEGLIYEIVSEIERATASNAAFNSAHEGYAVILEELDELWEEVKKKRVERDPKKMTREAVQVAAMAIRFVMDVCYSPQPSDWVWVRLDRANVGHEEGK